MLNGSVSLVSRIDSSLAINRYFDMLSGMPRCGGEDPVAAVWLDSCADLDGSTAEHPLHLLYFCRIT
jgi:hypothetical protein